MECVGMDPVQLTYGVYHYEMVLIGSDAGRKEHERHSMILLDTIVLLREK